MDALFSFTYWVKSNIRLKFSNYAALAVVK